MVGVQDWHSNLSSRKTHDSLPASPSTLLHPYLMDRSLPNETVEPGMAVLVAAPSLTPEPDALCTDLLVDADSSRQRILLVTLLRKPENRLRIWNHNGGESAPQAMAILTSSESSRPRDRRSDEAFALPDQTRIERMSIPPALTDLDLNWRTLRPTGPTKTARWSSVSTPCHSCSRTPSPHG